MQRPLIDRSAAEVLAWCTVLLVLGTLLAIDLIKFGQLNRELMGWLGGIIAALMARGAVPAMLPRSTGDQETLQEIRELRDQLTDRRKLREQLEENTGEIRRLREAVVDKEVDDDPTRRSR